MKITIQLLVFIWISITSLTVRSETTGGGWLMYFSEHGIAPGWTLLTDVQLRQSAALDVTRQYHVRGTLTRDLMPGLRIGVGYLYGGLTDYDPRRETPNFENRIHEQIEIKNGWPALAVIQRLRFEQRFSRVYPATRFLNRVRYRIQTRWPKPLTTPIYASFYNELFMNFADGSGLNFNQNRLYTAIGMPLKRDGRLRAEIGYLWQANARGDREPLHVHALQVTLLFETPDFFQEM